MAIEIRIEKDLILYYWLGCLMLTALNILIIPTLTGEQDLLEVTLVRGIEF